MENGMPTPELRCIIKIANEQPPGIQCHLAFARIVSVPRGQHGAAMLTGGYVEAVKIKQTKD
jgi:hypothetical protein